MDEKTDIVPSDQLQAEDNNATSIVETVPSAVTVTEDMVARDALEETLTATETSRLTSTSEMSAMEVTNSLDATVPTETISSDALSVADALTSVDDLQSAEELTSQTTKVLEETNKTTTNTMNYSQGLCELEEELKRLHEGDPTENQKLGNNDDLQPLNKETSAIEMESKEGTLITTENALIKHQEEKPLNTESLIEQLTSKDLDHPVEMMDSESTEEIPVSDIAKDPTLIKSAQEELKIIDVLVCGRCHEVFHFLEEYQLHKSDNLGKCSGKSNILSICEGEIKPQIWGFTLWKNKYSKLLKEGETMPSSWAIYQKWVKLPQTLKDSWITAGHSLQFCCKISSAKITEIKAKTQPIKQQAEKDPLALDGFADSNKENSTIDNVGTEKRSATSEVVKKTIVKPVRLNSDVRILPSNKITDTNVNSNKALRTVRSTEKREYVVERIVAKRFNPKRKTWEYQIKWENFPSEDNTWEPISNLNHCKQMVDEFEEQLRKLKAEKAKQQAAGVMMKGRGRPIKSTQSFLGSSPSSSGDLTPGRPTRSSKQKALSQVKAWCGNISDADEGGVKRSFEDDDSDDSFEKKMKYEDYSDDSDIDVKPVKPILKKVTTKPMMQIVKNGVGKTSPLPHNVLIPDANGVVRINQKQLPSLSTGVYIMSKTAGIIKLDSTTSKVATSGGQTIVKVAPKIGQTQIKIVKKDGGTTTAKQIIQVTPNTNMKSITSVPVSAPTKIYKPVVTKVKKLPEILQKPAPTKMTVKNTAKPVEESKKVELPKVENEESDDDGLEELPFPDVISIPEPESPPSDFVLDPFTGKIAGQEYPEPSEHFKPESEDSSLENIVKLAAADITEDDLKNTVDTPMEATTDSDKSEQERDITTPKKTQVKPVVMSPPGNNSAVKITTTPTLVKSEPSLLTKALSGSAILRKSLLNTSPSPPKVQQRILNQSVARSHQMSSLVRSPISRGSSLIRTRPIAPRSKFNISSSPNIIKTQHEHSPKNVYSKPVLHTVTRKIGNTTIRSTTSAAVPQKTQARIVQASTNIHKVSPKKEFTQIRTLVTEKTLLPTKSKTVISMPSLIGDDEHVLSPTVTEAVKPPASVVTTSAPSTDTEATPTIATTEFSAESTTTTTTTSDSSSNTLTTDISSFTLADNENPIFITGDDGTVYQVAGQNEQGQTILLTQGSDGQQQCLLVTNEVAETMETSTEDPQTELSIPEVSTNVTDPLTVKTDTDTTDQVVAQVVRAEPPSPGGTHKVVVMLPDGNLMVTQVSPEEYASLELE